MIFHLNKNNYYTITLPTMPTSEAQKRASKKYYEANWSKYQRLADARYSRDRADPDKVRDRMRSKKYHTFQINPQPIHNIERSIQVVDGALAEKYVFLCGQGLVRSHLNREYPKAYIDIGYSVSYERNKIHYDAKTDDEMFARVKELYPWDIEFLARLCKVIPAVFTKTTKMFDKENTVFDIADSLRPMIDIPFLARPGDNRPYHAASHLTMAMLLCGYAVQIQDGTDVYFKVSRRITKGDNRNKISMIMTMDDLLPWVLTQDILGYL